MKPNFDNCHFYLGRIPEGLPSELSESLDGILASELFLHLTVKEVRDSMEMAKQNLRDDGNFMFTAYTRGIFCSLDQEFARLGEEVGMEREDFIEGGVINIRKLAEELKREGLYEENKRKYWLDLEQVRTFSETNLRQWAEDFGLRVVGGYFWRNVSFCMENSFMF